jgi:hypothetical protein
MRRLLFTLFSALSLLLCIAVCVLWVRGRWGSDEADWRYDRYLPDRSAASTQAYLSSNKRVWLSLSWGQVGPYNGQLVWGYYVNADQSGGRPRLTFRRLDYRKDLFLGSDDGPAIDPDALDDGTSGWGPLRWQSFARSDPAAGERSRFIRVGVSHWMLALCFLGPPIVWLRGARKARRARATGTCPGCGYDLRATPDRCPECGAIPKEARC